MSEETLAPHQPARSRSKPSHLSSKQHAPSNAVLTSPARCPIDLPILDAEIPQAIVMSLRDQEIGYVTDSMLNLAILGCEMPDFALKQDQTFAQNVIQAADFRLQQVIAPIRNSVSFRWWGSTTSATEGRDSIELGTENSYIDSQSEMHMGQRPVIEFDLMEDGDVFYATTLLNSSAPLDKCESICPGFTHMLYTVLECVNNRIWPVITPRSFWNDLMCSEGWYGNSTMCDAEIAKFHLGESCYEDELEEKYGEGNIEELDPQNAVSIFHEEVGGTLPSDLIHRFGRAVIGEWIMGPGAMHESLCDPTDQIATDICSAMASVEARLDWCPSAPFALKQLMAMHTIVRQIANGAVLARGANHFGQPSRKAIHVHRFSRPREKEHFVRSLDDAGQCAMECGETTDSTGWFCKDMSTIETTTKAIFSMEQGVEVLRTTCNLLLDLFYNQNQDA